MTDLIATLGGLTSPSREVDALILAWSENRTVRYEDGNLLAKSNHAPCDECVLGWIDPGKNDRNFTPQSEKQPRFTASLDAATALVERVLPGWSHGYRTDPIHRRAEASIASPWFWTGEGVRADGMGISPSPAIALCIALIRALEARDAS